MEKKYFEKVPEWYKSNEKFDLVLSDDIDRLNKKYPNFIEDVGIAEEHAASYAASLALNNQKVMLFYYSTFFALRTPIIYTVILHNLA